MSLCRQVGLSNYNKETLGEYLQKIKGVAGANKCKEENTTCLHGWRTDVLE